MDNRIKEYLELNNYMVVDLIRLTGLSKSYLYAVMSKKMIPSVINAKKIANALNTNIDDLFILKNY